MRTSIVSAMAGLGICFAGWQARQRDRRCAKKRQSGAASTGLERYSTE
jgi:hypothetical protein